MGSCSASPGDLNASGDNLYIPRSCYQPFIDWVWDAYDFDKGDWDDGFGYYQACDVGRPLARTFNGLWCLEYSAPDYWDESYSKPIINWAGRYARENLDELDGRCGSWSGPFATTYWGPIIDNKTELYMRFFFEAAVSQRAGTIIHEARHASWKGHDNDPDDSSWGYNGAWRYHVSWLAWFTFKCENTSAAMKTAAVQRANNILNNNFTTEPGFRISSTGTKIPFP